MMNPTFYKNYRVVTASGVVIAMADTEQEARDFIAKHCKTGELEVQKREIMISDWETVH